MQILLPAQVKHFVYILQSLKDHKYYIGYTINLPHRLECHNLGINISTKYRRPLELRHFEVFENKKEALAREKQIKSYKGGEAFKRLIESN